MIKPIADAYSYIGFDCGKLESHAVVAENIVMSETETLSVNTLVKKLFDMKCAFPDLVTFVQLVLTIPVSSAGAERNFSTMKRVKNYLHTAMSDARLSHLCVLSIERGLSGELLVDPSSVDGFAESGKRRLLLKELD